MGVVERPVNLLCLDGRQRVLRWRFAAPFAFEQFVTVGWMPDGSWWVSASWYRLGALLYVGDTSAEAREAAVAKAREWMDEPRPRDGEWAPTIATFEPGVIPARAAVVADWPPGHEPD